MAGVSLSLMRLDEDSRAALDASTAAPAWVPATCPADTSVVPAPAQTTAETSTGEGDPTLLRVTLACCDAIIAAEPELTRMDQIVGDGDIGRLSPPGQGPSWRPSRV